MTAESPTPEERIFRELTPNEISDELRKADAALAVKDAEIMELTEQADTFNAHWLRALKDGADWQKSAETAEAKLAETTKYAVALHMQVTELQAEHLEVVGALGQAHEVLFALNVQEKWVDDALEINRAETAEGKLATLQAERLAVVGALRGAADWGFMYEDPAADQVNAFKAIRAALSGKDTERWLELLETWHLAYEWVSVVEVAVGGMPGATDTQTELLQRMHKVSVALNSSTGERT